MNPKSTQGYLWANEQQDRWEELATEKINQLDQILQRHLDWFTRHATVR